MKTLTKPTTPPSLSAGPVNNLVGMRRDPLEFLSRAQQEHGDVIQLKIATRQVYMLSHPDYIRDVLVTNNRKFVKGRGVERLKRMLGEGLITSEGEFHLRQRRIMQPAFHRQRLAAYASIMSGYASDMSRRWEDGQTLDISQEMMRLTLGIVGKTLFDADVESEASEVRESLTTAMELFAQTSRLPFAELLEKLPLPSTRRFNRARARLDATIYRLIQEHRSGGVDRGDLLSMLLMSQDPESPDGSRMTNEQLRDEAMTLLLAGHETTSNALTWTWYLLAQNPDIEERLHAEINTVLAGRTPTVEDLPRLKYTEMVLTESMRVYPPVWVIARKTLEDYPVGGYTIPAGSGVLMSQYVVHHDPRWYPEPSRFDPERWTEEARAKRPKFSYFPFGGGPRICLGEQFAWMEGVLLLATLAQDWTLRPLPDHPVATQPLVTLRPRYGMKMVLHRRQSGEQK